MRSLGLFFLASVALAQSGGAISGRVVNLPGEVVPNAPIVATNVATKAVYKSTSSNKGLYTLANVPPGTYEISVALLGYNPFTQKDLTVGAAKVLQLDIHLIDYQFDTLGDGREFRVDLYSPHPTPSGPTPRTADGKPDFTAVWYAQRPVDLGKPEPLPWADALVRERAANNSKDAPGARCLSRGILAAGALFPYKLVQTPKLLVMLFEDDIPQPSSSFFRRAESSQGPESFLDGPLHRPLGRRHAGGGYVRL